jgi:hypothetical protein
MTLKFESGTVTFKTSPTVEDLGDGLTVETVEATSLPIHNAVVETAIEEDETEQMVTRYIELYKKLQEYDVTPITKEMDEIKKTLQSIATEQIEPSSPAIFSSSAGEIEFGKCTDKKVFNSTPTLLEDLKAKFGPDAILAVCKIGVTELGKLLSPLEMKKYYTIEPGSRSLKSVRPKNA